MADRSPTLSEPGAKLAVGGILGHAVSAAGKEAVDS
jgi:hypothetical protein